MAQQEEWRYPEKAERGNGDLMMLIHTIACGASALLAAKQKGWFSRAQRRDRPIRFTVSLPLGPMEVHGRSRRENAPSSV